MILLSTIGFSAMLDIIMGSESRLTIDTALLGNFLNGHHYFVQGKTIIRYHFRQNRSKFGIFYER